MSIDKKYDTSLSRRWINGEDRKRPVERRSWRDSTIDRKPYNSDDGRDREKPVERRSWRESTIDRKSNDSEGWRRGEDREKSSTDIVMEENRDISVSDFKKLTEREKVAINTQIKLEKLINKTDYKNWKDSDKMYKWKYLQGEKINACYVRLLYFHVDKDDNVYIVFPVDKSSNDLTVFGGSCVRQKGFANHIDSSYMRVCNEIDLSRIHRCIYREVFEESRSLIKFDIDYESFQKCERLSCFFKEYQILSNNIVYFVNWVDQSEISQFIERYNRISDSDIKRKVGLDDMDLSGYREMNGVKLVKIDENFTQILRNSIYFIKSSTNKYVLDEIKQTFADFKEDYSKSTIKDIIDCRILYCIYTNLKSFGFDTYSCDDIKNSLYSYIIDMYKNNKTCKV